MIKGKLVFLFEVLLCVLVCVGVGFALLLAVFSLDADKTGGNISKSAEVFVQEGNYPRVYAFSGIKQQDNFTDAIMLGSAAYIADKGVVDRAVNIYRAALNGKSPSESLVSYYVDGLMEKESAYARYWHGYLIILKPMLALFTYQQIRIINILLMMIITAGILYLMHKRGYGNYIVPYALSVLSISFVSTGRSLQYSSVFYIFSIASAIVVGCGNRWKSKNRVALLFVAVGCETSYFDLLTYPIATLGMPLIAHIFITEELSSKDKIYRIIQLSVCWGIGYIGMWASKWALDVLLNGNDSIDLVIKKLTERSSSEIDGTRITIIKTELLNIRYFIMYNCAVVLSAVYLIYRTVGIVKMKIDKALLYKATPFILTGIMPFCWYALTRNHSATHYWFTSRGLMVALFAVLCMVECMYKNRKSIAQIK